MNRSDHTATSAGSSRLAALIALREGASDPLPCWGSVHSSAAAEPGALNGFFEGKASSQARLLRDLRTGLTTIALGPDRAGTQLPSAISTPSPFNLKATRAIAEFQESLALATQATRGACAILQQGATQHAAPGAGSQAGHARCEVDALVVDVAPMFGTRPARPALRLEARRVAAAIPTDDLLRVLLNLGQNAQQALHDHPNARLEIRTWASADGAFIEVADNGPGVPEAIRAHAFAPGVSGRSGGTGLGLAICDQLLGRWGGEIRFASTPGDTRFLISLLRADAT